MSTNLLTKTFAERLRTSRVWSATPTPFDDDLGLDVPSVERLVAHHRQLGCDGLFLGGTCGEGPWMPERDLRNLVRCVRREANGELLIAVQVTDNSAARILDNMEKARQDGADLAIIAPPRFMMNATARRMFELYREAVEKSPLPVGIYDCGNNGAVVVPVEVLEDIYALPNVVLVKDSSMDPARRDAALRVREAKGELHLTNGYEFSILEYMEAGYDGVMFGGTIFTGYLVNQILDLWAGGEKEEARRLEAKVVAMLYTVYGGKDLTCWLSGLKRLMVELGVFGGWKNHLGYPLTEECLHGFEALVCEEKEFLLPGNATPLRLN